jgi:ABC-type bacteriocin/lantibiotic exporter with double-glycine peptidase domain
VNVTPYQQEQPHTCAVACLRMAAEYLGVARTEAELLPLCGTTLDGTTPD